MPVARPSSFSRVGFLRRRERGRPDACRLAGCRTSNFLPRTPPSIRPKTWHAPCRSCSDAVSERRRSSALRPTACAVTTSSDASIRASVFGAPTALPAFARPQAALAWEAAALTVMRRQRRTAIEELDRRGNSPRSAGGEPIVEACAAPGSVSSSPSVLTVALVAGCGGVSPPSSSSASLPGGCAEWRRPPADAFAAVKEAGSGHFALDADVNASGRAAAMAGDGPCGSNSRATRAPTSWRWT